MPPKAPIVETADRILVAGQPEYERCNNMVTTSKYTMLSFFPVAILEQFRRVANMYFLVIGTIMAFGWYTELYESAISPWTTLGPLAFVVCISLLQEGAADAGRHRSDQTTNNHPCVVLRRASELDEENGERDTTVLGSDVGVNLTKSYFMPSSASASESTDCKVAFESIKRMNIRQGHLVLIRNRDMVPADLILVASSADNGNAYIETSSIDGETNLKLRASPHLPKAVIDTLSAQSERELKDDSEVNKPKPLRETLEQATKRVCRISKLGFPNGRSALENPANPVVVEELVEDDMEAPSSGLHLVSRVGSVAKMGVGAVKKNIESRRESSRHLGTPVETEIKYVTAVKTEPPNASVNTFTGVMLLPAIELGGPSVEIPLGADNILLRGAILRNTEWAIGLVCYTGKDTKLVQNSFETPSKFSRLDQIMNRTVLYILCIVGLCIAYLSTMAVITSAREDDNLWYVGINANATASWPYLEGLDPPKWEEKSQNWIQVYLLFITLLSNFVPLSLYVTIEVVTVFLRVLINLDVNMYDEFTDTRTVARSTTVTDLGQVEYIFSDKTGTLTQNVMRFKRCSVDALVFGAPIIKATAGRDDDDDDLTAFHPLSKILVGKIPSFDSLVPNRPAKRQASGGLASLGGASKVVSQSDSGPKSNVTTFNAEMFLRVMSLCHTVVVEKDFDANKGNIKSTKAVPTSFGASIHQKLFKRSVRDDQNNDYDEEQEDDGGGEQPKKEEQAEQPANGKGKGGAPIGFAYQAESPDEGALVEASSQNFDYQVVGRGSTGIRLSVQSPSLLSDPKIIDGFKDGTLSEMELAADTASADGTMGSGAVRIDGPHEETWEVLAVNKFDSTRKRMSVLVRSPPELGSIPMILCKGADSAMLDAKVLRNPTHAMMGDESVADVTQRGCEPDDSDAAEADRSCVLSLQSHLGEFAREGLRTLVLGVRILTEQECTDWMAEYTAAATSLKNRDEKLTEAATNIETNIHVVGATAIEDKLQVGVPGTIALLGRAGIKLWVLTGDKRETAKEIGYATKVLSEKMRPGLIEVPQGTEDEVRVKMAMTFLKLVKYAKLPNYQTAAISSESPQRFETILFKFGKFKRRLSRALRRFYHKRIKTIFQFCFSGVSPDDPALKLIDLEESKEKDILQLTERYRNVRNRAEQIVREYLDTPEGMSQRKSRGKVDPNGEIPDEDMNIRSGGPDVFDRADSARDMLEGRRSKAGASESEIRDLTMANLTAHEVASDEAFGTLVDEDILSMKSFLPTDGEQNKKDFDKMKRTLLERLFAVDKAARHGRLVKHLKKEKLSSIIEDGPAEQSEAVPATGDVSLDGPRGLVIEGAALEKMLGDAELEEILFAVANTCDSVIACRVSPAQKAQLVQLVRRYVVPEPVTLAIGDGANDVGMIQEAHVGIGISGKEGQQAVNASDFAIAQFRFLQDLTLIHGRWNFFRLSTVVLFSFYKNALMAGVLIAYTSQSLFSGTPLFDEWLIAMLNFVANFPIVILGMFDRCLDRDYVLNNPTTYTPTRRNELITKRILARWVILVFVHCFTIYYLTVPSMSVEGGGATPAFVGLMYNDNLDRPGDGESGDIKSVGFVAFTTLIIILSLKVVFESKAIIIGRWPAFQCWKKGAEGWPNRLAYTWIANGWLSIGFYIMSVYIYQSLGRAGPSSFSQFVETVYHVFNTSTRAWTLIFFVPIAAMCFDVTAKLFSNLYYPTQTQIHVEIFAGKGKKTNEKFTQHDKPSAEGEP